MAIQAPCSRGELEDDNWIPIEGGTQARVRPGDYLARIIYSDRNGPFGKVQFRFDLVLDGSGHHMQLDGFASSGEEGKARSRSKLARWYRTLCHVSEADPSKVNLRHFEDFLLRVRVRTVTYDHNKLPLAEHNQYEVVDDILGVERWLGNKGNKR